VRILFDQGTPVPLRTHLIEHEVSTAYELGWSQLQNGELLSQAQASGFDALLTTDQNLRYQQSLPSRHLAIIVLMTTSWPRIERHLPVLVAQINSVEAGAYIEIAVP
jgi:hypothetical protein